MRRPLGALVIGVSLGVLPAVGLAPSARAQAAGASAASTYRELLSPYGMWVSLAPYGEVWVPREAARPDFVPYASGGRWVDGARGLIFESTLPWGAVCLHHGRWVRPRELDAWAWVPGDRWAPSWVEWRVEGAHAAWRPMAPTGERNTSPWLLARVADLGAPELAGRARMVDEEDVASFTRGLPHLIAEPAPPAVALASVEPTSVEPTSIEPASIEPVVEETSRVGRATAGPGEVVLSGGGRIVVHERGGARVIEVPPTIVRRDSPEARAAEARQRAAIERQAEREREAAQRTQAIIARAETREREAREARATPPPAPTPPPPTTIVAQPVFGGFPFGGFGTGALGVGGYGYTYGRYAPSTWGSVGFPATPRRPTDALTPGAVSPRFDARLPFGTWRD
jgi:hypothetical protein